MHITITTVIRDILDTQKEGFPINNNKKEDGKKILDNSFYGSTINGKLRN